MASSAPGGPFPLPAIRREGGRESEALPRAPQSGIAARGAYSWPRSNPDGCWRSWPPVAALSGCLDGFPKPRVAGSSPVVRSPLALRAGDRWSRLERSLYGSEIERAGDGDYRGETEEHLRPVSGVEQGSDQRHQRDGNRGAD
jgi:hypothetical protein